MARRSDAAAQAAAEAANRAASEAGRTLQQRGQEAKQERVEPKQEKPEAPVTQVKARNEPRRQMLEEMEKLNDERHGLKAEEEKVETPEPKNDAAPAETPPPQEAAPPAPQSEAASPKTVKVKIYGEEKDVPESEVEEYGGVKGYQIAMAAKKDREELKAQLDQARQQSQLIAQLIQQQKPVEPEKPPEAVVAGLMDEIRFGTPEQASAAFQKALQAMQQKAPSEQDIILKATVNFQHDAAQKAFQREFADLLTTPEMKQFASLLNQQQLSQYVVNGQPNWQALATVDFDNHYRTIGNRIRGMFGGKTQAAPATTETGKTSASDKESRKASIVNLPTAAARATQPEPEKEQTREEIIAEARAKRRP